MSWILWFHLVDTVLVQAAGTVTNNSDMHL